MEAIVLAGGFGTRLRPCVENLPKPLAPVCGRPFLLYLLDYLYVNGVHRAIISTGYMADEVVKAVGSKHRGTVIDYCREETPLGTGGGIKKALSMCKDDFAVVINGDTFFDVDLFEMRKFHRSTGCPTTLAAKEIPDVYRSGCIRTENGKLTGFSEKGITGAGKINGGIYFINKNALENISEDKFSFEKTVLESGDYEIGVFESDGYFIDIGIPEAYNLAQTDCDKLKSTRKRRAVFIDRDGTVNKDTVHLFRKEDFEFLPDADKAIAEIKKSDYLAVVVTNQAGIAKGLYSPDDADSLHSYIDSLLNEKLSVIADGYYYCPHHPDAVVEKYKKICSCRKPQPGLILRAVSDFAEIGIEIDLEKSFMVGNRSSDTLAGLNAGIKNSILIGSDEPFNAETASAHYESLYDFSLKIKQVF